MVATTCQNGCPPIALQVIGWVGAGDKPVDLPRWIVHRRRTIPARYDRLCKIEYLEEIIIGLDKADERQFRHAREYFARLPQDTRILWQDGPGMKQIEEKTVELFADNLTRAGEMFLNLSPELPFMPSWNRVLSAVPEIFALLHETVERDNRD